MSIRRRLQRLRRRLFLAAARRRFGDVETAWVNGVEGFWLGPRFVPLISGGAGINPVFDPGDAITMTASAAITGGRCVTMTGNRRVAEAGAGATVVGVALTDAVAEGEVTIQRVGVFRLTGAAITTAGQLVIPAANGQVTPIAAAAADAASIEATRDVVGVVYEGAAAAALCIVALRGL